MMFRKGLGYLTTEERAVIQTNINTDSPEAFVRRVYQSALNREPSAAELSGQASALTTYFQGDRQKFLNHVLSSAEYALHPAPTPPPAPPPVIQPPAPPAPPPTEEAKSWLDFDFTEMPVWAIAAAGIGVFLLVGRRK